MAILATLIALFYAEENWRGRRDWEKYKMEAEARGEDFDWQKFLPPAVPDDQNFAMTPFLKPLLDLNPRPFNGPPWRDTNGYNRAQDFAKDLLNAYNSPGNLLAIYPVYPMDLTNLAWKLNHPRSDSRSEGPIASRSKRKVESKPSDSGQPMHRTEAAQFILDYINQYSPVLDEIRAASQRPYARFNVHYDDKDPAGILLPHLVIIKKLSVVFQIEASCDLALGKTDAAAQDVEEIIRLANSVRGEPFIISYLVRIAVLNFGEKVIWEGMARNQWSDAQLQMFENDLRSLSLLADGRRGLEAERSGFKGRWFDVVREDRQYLRNFFDYGNGEPTADLVLLSFAPNGWLYLEQLNFQKVSDERFMPVFDKDATRIFPEVSDHAKAEFQKFLPAFAYNNMWSVNEPPPASAYHAPRAMYRLLHHRVLEVFLAPGMENYFKKPAVAQTGVDQTVTACALERYRMANTKYPETLDVLVPKFMDKVPLDVCNGEPMKYHRTDDGRFLLYSVGWNCTDDGGEIVPQHSTKLRVDVEQGKQTINLEQGDWVWPEYK
jgi:hypothetical protein